MNQVKIILKKEDEVVIKAGKDKGKKGKVVKIIKKTGRVVVAGLNLAKKHQRPRRQGEKGEIVSVPQAVDLSNVGLYCGNCGRAVRSGHRIEGEKKIRICKKCQTPI